MALVAAMFGAFTIASIAKGEDFATIASSGVAFAVLAGLWYFVGWLQNR